MSMLFFCALERTHDAEIRPIWLTVQDQPSLITCITYYLYCDKNPPSNNWNLNENTSSDC